MTQLVGNDVVDLHDPVAAGAHARPRFVSRVCAPAEQQQVASADDACQRLWALFAAKEAAYKAIAKRRCGLVFAHRRFAVAPDLRSVHYCHGGVNAELDLEVSVTREYVHAVATWGIARSVPLWCVERVDEGADLSAEARRLLRRTLAGRMGCRERDLAVVRRPRAGSWDGYGPPLLYRLGAKTHTDISLSHDGRFVAFCAG